jgi:hypothetical protein
VGADAAPVDEDAVGARAGKGVAVQVEVYVWRRDADGVPDRTREIAG